MIHCGKIPQLPNITVLHRGTERFNVVMQQYPLHYQLSKSRQAKYWEEKHVPTLPKYILEGLTKSTYAWKERKVGKKKVLTLFNTAEDEFVVKNTRVAGKPRIHTISGQEFWTGGEHSQWNRMKLKEQLMGYFIPRLVQQLPAEIVPFNRYTVSKEEWEAKKDTLRERFIHIEYLFFRNWTDAKLDAGNAIQDLDNHSYPYMKVFKDTLQHLGIIKNDDPRWVRGGYPHYIHIDNDEDRRLEVKIHFCENEQSIQRPVYQYVDESVSQSDPL